MFVLHYNYTSYNTYILCIDIFEIYTHDYYNTKHYNMPNSNNSVKESDPSSHCNTIVFIRVTFDGAPL